MLPLLYALILIGLMPMTLRLAVNVDRGRKVTIEINAGPFTIRPRFGQGRASIQWLRGMAKRVKPPVPIKRLPAMTARLLDIELLRVRC